MKYNLLLPKKFEFKWYAEMSCIPFFYAHKSSKIENDLQIQISKRFCCYFVYNSTIQSEKFREESLAK